MIGDFDRELLRLLGHDGRQSFRELAQQLGVSETTVRNHLARLQESGIVRIVALCDPQSLGHQVLRLLIRTQDLTPRAVAGMLTNVLAVNHVALCAGGHDIYVEATCRDLDQLVELLDEVRRLPGIANIEQLVVLEIFKDYSWSGLGESRGQDPDG
ncbi:MAG: Lrp/AsnC family transcriptional regulator [Gordonia sp. (in: high G+C Gram-positive bacteria)]